MGYYTDYELIVDPYSVWHECPTCGHTSFINHQENLCKYIGYDPFEQACKWYDWKVDMIAYSKKFPEFIFTLHGEGEESGDIWTAYFMGGKVQVEKAQVQIGGFDPDKLE